MESINKISVKKLLWDKEIVNSRLELNIQGKNINNTILNTLRRIGTTYVPIYAFTNIDITENTSIFNNNYLKLRLSNLPVFGIETDTNIFVKEEIQVNKIDDVTLNMDDVDMRIDDQVNISTLKQLTMYLEYHNQTTNIVTVGTNDCKFYFREKQIKTPYPVNIPIVKLQPDQKIKLSAITGLGIEEESSIFSPVSIFTFREKENNNYDLILESRGQINEKKILDIIYHNIINQLDKFYESIPSTKELEGTMSLENADHTLGNIISNGLQSHTSVEFGGYNMPHPLGNNILFHYKLKSSNIEKILQDIVNYYKQLFTKLNVEIQNM